MNYKEFSEKYLGKVLTNERESSILNSISELNVTNKPTGGGFGFSKRKTDKPNRVMGLKNVNNVDFELPFERLMNCQRCVVALEVWMRGYDVIARPSWGDNDPMRITKNWLSVFDYSPKDIKKCEGKTAEEVIKSAERIMRSFGEGAKAVVWFAWKNNQLFGKGHVIASQ